MRPYANSTLIYFLLLIGTAISQFSPNDTGRNCAGLDYNNGNLCIPCPSGMLSDASGFRCRNCPPGKYYFFGKCAKCPAGYFLKDGFICSECPFYTFSDKPNSPKCMDCPENKTTVAGSSSNTGCYGCGPGQYFLAQGTDCKPCSPGFYQDEFNQASCKPCPAGTTGDFLRFAEGYNSPEQCRKCPPGTGAVPQTAPSEPAAFCPVCPDGYYAPKRGTSQCIRCPSASKSSEDRVRCVPRCDQSLPWCRKRGCPPGTEPVQGDVRNCKKCPDGTYNDRWSTTQCAECPASEFPDYEQVLKPNANRDACACPKDSIVSKDILGICENCPAGTTKFDEKTCRCPPGMLLDGSTCKCKIYFKAVGKLCLPCSKAELASSRAGNNICGLCERGFYYNKIAGDCQQCPNGTITYRPNDLTTCERDKYAYFDENGIIRCKPGSEPASRGICRPCPIGTASVSYLSRCDNCGEQFYSDVPGLRTCKLCPKGQRYSRRRKQTACPPLCHANAEGRDGKCVCLKNFYREDSSNGIKCVPCPPNEVRSDYANERKCICKDGYWRKKGKCVECPPGSSGTNGYCNKCQVNTIAPRGGMTNCRPCPPGAYSIFEGGTRCTRCAAGQFVTKAGGCGKCAPGFRVRNGECVACVDSVSEGGDAAYCRPCPRGKIPGADGRTCTFPKPQ